MKQNISFGWRVPDFPEYGADNPTFRRHIFDYMDVLQAASWHSAWVGDHFFPFLAELDQSMDTIEAWTTLTYLMAKYTKMHFGTIVLSQSYRPPAILAKMAAVAQWLSEGRFILGIGAGWKEDEYRAYGYEFPRAKVRLDQLEEAVQIILKMWHEDSPSFHGAYYHIENAACSPKPEQPIPLLIGGTGPRRTLNIVAKYADWCNLNNSTLIESRQSLEVLQKHCQRVGRDYQEIVKTYACDSLIVAARRDEVNRIRDSSYSAKFGLPIAGTPDEVSDQIKAYTDLGVTHFILRFADFPRTDGVKLFIREVLPRFS